MPPDGEKDGGKEAGRQRGVNNREAAEERRGGEIKMYKRCSEGRTLGEKEKGGKERRCAGTAMPCPHKSYNTLRLNAEQIGRTNCHLASIYTERCAVQMAG